MRTTTRAACLFAFSSFIFADLQSQDIRAFNQNASRSNDVRMESNDSWSFGINTGASFGVKSNESTLFRGNSIATRMFGRYYFGNIGLGFTNGIIPGSISDNALNKFMTERKFPQDQLQITKSKPFNSYFLFGPSVRFGRRVSVNAEIQGGLFFNNPGAVNIAQAGVSRALYRFDGGDKNLFPGVSGGISIAYPINRTTHFFINTDYLQSKTSIRVLDPQGGIDVATQVNRDVKLFTAGIGIIKSFSGGREAGSGMATGRKHIGNVKYENINRTAREAGSGMATGRLIDNEDNNAILSPRDAQSGLPTGRRMYQPGRPVYGNRQTIESCGPVTLSTTNADGTTEQRTFACPDDAAQYNERISMNVTVPKQTQGATFGEKVNQGLHAAGGALSQGAARGIISGSVSWANDNTLGIVTNEMAAVSSVGNLAGGGSGAAAASYAATGRLMNNTTNTQGVVTTIYAREAGTGMATGRRQYEPVFNEEFNNICNECAVNAKLIAHELTHVVQQSGGSVKNSPLYNDNGSQGTNPMYEQRKNGGKTGGLCGSTDHFIVVLTNIGNGQLVAKTKTDSCGNFWFANVPVGNYAVRVKGDILVQKKYEVNITKEGKQDVAGEMLADDNQLMVQFNKSIDDSDNQKAKVTVRGWDPKKKESISGTANNKVGEAGMLLGGALPGGAVISSAFVAGQPIGGIIVKGGKNPGGSLLSTQTNEYGEFEFTNLEKGNYTISADIKYSIDDETIVTISDDNEGMNERKGWDGTVKGGNKADQQQQRKMKGKIIKSGDSGMLMMDANDPITFRWTPLVPKPKETVTYRLRVWQLMQGQNGTQAKQSNQPIAEKTVTGATEATVEEILTGPCKPPYLCDFIWTVQAISNNGTPEGNSDEGSFSTGKPKIKTQNNNTVRSNRTELKSILIEADLDGDGEYEADVTDKVTDEIVLDENGNIIAPQQKTGISTSRSNIRNRSSLQRVDDGLYVSYGHAVINNKDTSVKTVLKTKHDTAKNSVGNIR